MIQVAIPEKTDIRNPSRFAFAKLPLWEKIAFAGKLTKTTFVNITDVKKKRPRFPTHYKTMHPLEITGYLLERAETAGKKGNESIRAEIEGAAIHYVDGNEYNPRLKLNRKERAWLSSDYLGARVNYDICTKKEQRTAEDVRLAIEPIRRVFSDSIRAAENHYAINAAKYLIDNDYPVNFAVADVKDIAWAAIILERTYIIADIDSIEVMPFFHKFEKLRVLMKDKIKNGNPSETDRIMVKLAMGEISKESAISELKVKYYGSEEAYQEKMVDLKAKNPKYTYGDPDILALEKYGHIKRKS
jgi:hypothetical protein